MLSEPLGIDFSKAVCGCFLIEIWIKQSTPSKVLRLVSEFCKKKYIPGLKVVFNNAYFQERLQYALAGAML